jgi:hypothetical protein
MRFRMSDAPRGREREAMFFKDCHESSTLRGVQDELTDRAQKDAWDLIPDAKIPARKQQDGALAQVLASIGLDSLDGLVCLNDILDTRAEAHIPEGHDRALRARLRESLLEVKSERDIKESFQYMAGVDSITDDNGTWHVQLSRQRRRRLERTSKEHAAEVASAVAQEEAKLTDAHGNELLPMIEAIRRVATAKEVKRIKKATASRRRAGETVTTDDELESANLTRAPPDSCDLETQKEAKPTHGKVKNGVPMTPAKTAHIIKAAAAAATRGGMTGSPEPISPSSRDLAASDLMYLEPPTPWMVTPGGASLDGNTASSSSSGSWMLVQPSGMSRGASSTSC